MGETQRSSGWRLGSVAGIPLIISPGWLWLAGSLFMVYSTITARALPQLGAAHYAVALVLPVAFAATVLAHEFGHALVGAACRLKAVRIVIDGLGGETEFAQDPRTPARAFLIAAAGPVASGLVATVCMVGARSVVPGSVADFVLGQLALGNALLALFNLLPGLPLDGGYMLHAVIWRVTGQYRIATTVTAVSGLVLAAALVVVPMGLLLDHGGGRGLLGIVILVAVAGPIASGAWSALRDSDADRASAELNAGALGHPAVFCSPASTVQEALRILTARAASALVLVDERGRTVGLVDQQGLAGVPAGQRSITAVGQIADPLAAHRFVSADLAGAELLARVRDGGSPVYLITRVVSAPPAVLLAADVESAIGHVGGNAPLHAA